MRTSCTAGRASFITGQSGLRTGLTKVGLPRRRASELQKEDPTTAELLKPLGYATGQFGENHLGDHDELYHRAWLRPVLRQPLPPECRGAGTAELSERPSVPEMTRGVMDCKASATDDPTIDPRFRRSAAGLHGHRPADEEADGDNRRRHR